MKKKITVSEAISVLTEALNNDEGYRIGWIANIAMSFKHEYARSTSPYKSKKDIHNISNEAAEHFVNLLCKNYKEK